MKKRKRPAKAPKRPEAPARPPTGHVARAVAEDILALAREALLFRAAYERLTGAIDQLKLREPYRDLVGDLDALLKRPEREAQSQNGPK